MSDLDFLRRLEQNSVPCHKCGCTGLHACTGSPMKPWTEEEKERFHKALEEIFSEENRMRHQQNEQ